ncbi:ABC transporter substrate-binding protein [Nocardia yamanashiensis]|uniref:ABC transporter substrate-binding protein n=1 Tax=Nocardia yamanashiensis TaxID=209247 RepID=UPI001E45A2BA|nr:ABC transporter substrate-binding protein [Nocardia yamanashiensis]UGT44025.1 ABC transporter substrate-binding protein [Nocardia yamanashiensis]
MRITAMKFAALAACTTTLLAGCGGRPESGGAAISNAAFLNLPVTTDAAVGSADSATWALYRDPTTVDPAQAFDYPENTVVSTLCDALLRQQPDGSLAPGLASEYRFTTPTTLVLKLRAGVKFWDGQPLTPADVAFSLRRNMDAKTGGFYATVLNRVTAVTTEGADTVTLTLSSPDYWLPGELSSMAGIVIQEKYALDKGQRYGTPDGGAMCTGPYKLGEWTAGRTLKAVANPDYWDTGMRPLTATIDFRGVSSAATLTTGLSTGEISGAYITDTSTFRELQQVANTSMHVGQSGETEFFIPADLTGVLGDLRVRQALSLAFDRKSFADAVYGGNAVAPRMSTNPGTWGYAKDTFAAAWNAATEPATDLARAKQLIRDAGAEGKTLVIGTSTGLATVNTAANAWLEAANSIGLKASLHNVSPQNYINFFTDPKAREGVDGFSTTTYGDYADPAALIASYTEPEGVQNYSGYDNPDLHAALTKAREQADPVQRAAATIEADRIVMSDLPWIPMVHPALFLITNGKLTGAPSSFAYMQAPWLAKLGQGK